MSIWSRAAAGLFCVLSCFPPWELLQGTHVTIFSPRGLKVKWQVAWVFCLPCTCCALKKHKLDERGMIMPIYQPVSCQACWHSDGKEFREFQIRGVGVTQCIIIGISCKHQHVLLLKIWLSTNSTDTKRGSFPHRLVDGEARRSYCPLVLSSCIMQPIYLGIFIHSICSGLYSVS